ncbi:MAG: CRISPR-associated protein Csx16 [Wenzhouxiangellaceae bacterium]|nr:CRISPR-associated protein Csx16 [Wenzhouxiangellaceae bacterium]
MTVHLVTRHQGAIDWLTSQGIQWDSCHAHLNIQDIARGDTVVGILPLPKAAAVCAKGARYLHVCIDVPADRRGEELSLAEMAHLSPTIREFHAFEASPAAHG